MQLFVIAAFCGLASSLAVPGNDVKQGSHNQVHTPPPSVTAPGTGPSLGYPPDPVPSQLSYYMCCQGSPSTPGIDHYYPPYACIFGPATGECPQGSGSSFPYAWLCVYQPGAVGNFDCTYQSGQSEGGIGQSEGGILGGVANEVGDVLADIGL